MSPFIFKSVGLGGSGRNCAVYDIGPVSRKGPVIGFVGEHAIHAWIYDSAYRRFEFAGIAPSLASGEADLRALGHGEFLYEGNLIYARRD